MFDRTTYICLGDDGQSDSNRPRQCDEQDSRFAACSSPKGPWASDHIEVFYEPCGQLLDEVFTAVLDSLMYFRHALALPLPVVGWTVRSFLLLSGKLLLLAAKPLLFAFELTWIPDFLTRGERHETFDAQVYSDRLKVAALSIGSREKIGFLFADEADVVLPCGIFHRPHQLLGLDGSSRDHRMLIRPGIFERRSFRYPFPSR
ncbi:hypothetical protein [Salinibacter ruber]|uniref:hypothetical protein n=1 Tax=Salinibacter ruber TaxID=146919 RepID=UPI002434215B|nr:hypothetical protein [Salinibacter ruber]MCS3612982.1 hypothetical protein [Salinibacter ruber]